jgi:serine/threonine protein kinase
MGELRKAVAEMHAHCVVHLDLRHRSNVLAGEDGRPILLDFASAVAFEPGRWPARWLMPQLARFDISALRKWETRLGG